MNNNPVSWLQGWYKSQCNGDWEHYYGVKIDTLDNPGWSIFIDISGTELESVTFNSIKIERSEEDWIHCKVEDNQFRGAGGSLNLLELLDTFRSWVISNTKS